MSRRRIGFMGGTFDPIHAQHVAIAACALEQAELDSVMIVPSGNPPHKLSHVASAEDRYRMAAVAVAREPGLTPSGIELEREGYVYSVDTLRLILKDEPDAKLFFIIGEDTLLHLAAWHKPDALFKLCTFLVCPRPLAEGERAALQETQKALEKRGALFKRLKTPVCDISSTALREELANGSDCPAGLSPAVYAYIRLLGLYGTKPWIDCPEAWLDRLFQALADKRFAHTLGVTYTAWQLAGRFGLNEKQVVTAALLHDCCKRLPLADMQQRARGLTDDPLIMESTALLHSVAGAYEAQHAYGVEDQAVLDAIRWHTTGRVNMSPLEMAVFVADKIEPTRADFAGLTQMREAARTSLSKAVLLSLEGTVAYVGAGKRTVHPSAYEVIHWLQGQSKS